MVYMPPWYSDWRRAYCRDLISTSTPQVVLPVLLEDLRGLEVVVALADDQGQALVQVLAGLADLGQALVEQGVRLFDGRAVADVGVQVAVIGAEVLAVRA